MTLHLRLAERRRAPRRRAAAARARPRRSRGRPPRPGPGDRRPRRCAGTRRDAGPGLGGDRGRLAASACPRCRTAVAPRDARHAYAVLRGLTSAGGGMVAAATMSPARAGRRGPQLRLPLRLDPRPVLRRPGRGRRRAAPAARRRRRVRRRAPARRRPAPQARVHRRPGRPVPDERSLDLPGYPGGTDIVGNWVNAQFQLDAFGESAAAARRRGPPRPPRPRPLAAPSRPPSTPSRPAGTEPDAGIWELDDRRWAHSRLICAAGLRAIADAAPRPSGRGGRRLADAHRRRHRRRLPAPRRALAARAATTPGSTPRCCCPASAARCRPTTRARVATLAAVARELGRRRLRLPVPPRRAPARRGRGSVRALRLPAWRWPPTSRATDGRGGALVRTQPGRVRPAGAVHRGVRRRPAPAARQPARRRSCTPCCSSRPPGSPTRPLARPVPTTPR